MAHAILENPVYAKEMRAWRHMPIALWIRRGYAAFMILIAVVATIVAIGSGAEVGGTVFFIVCGVELIAAMLLPAIFASATIAREREVDTLEAIIVTGLPPQRIIIGKFMAAIACMGMLVVYSLPPLVVAVGFRLTEDGPTLVHLIAGQLVIVSVVLFFSAVGVFASSLFKRTIYATSATMAVAAFVTIGLPIAAALLNYSGSGSSMAGVMMAVALAFAAAVIAAFGLFAATVMIIHSVRPGFQRERVWYIILYGVFVIGTTAMIRLPAVANTICNSDSYYESTEMPLLFLTTNPPVGMSYAVGFDVEQAGWSEAWQWQWNRTLLSLWLVGTYLALTGAVVFLARMRFARTRWRQ